MSTAWSIQNEARYEFLDGPGILPMDHDKKPVKSDSGQVKEAKSMERADEEVRPHPSYVYHTSHFPSCPHHLLSLPHHEGSCMVLRRWANVFSWLLTFNTEIMDQIDTKTLTKALLPTSDDTHTHTHTHTHTQTCNNTT